MSSDEEGSEVKRKSKQRHEKSRDAREGKTVFIKNLSFDTSKEELSQFCEQFGKTEYCLLCKDEFGHPRGTAFCKFVSKEDCEKCLESFQSDQEKFILNDRRFQVLLALTRGKAAEASMKKNTKPRDKRNLYLAKEGLIYPDSPAAEGVSQNDLAKRLMLERSKRERLQNLNNFVSRNRLCFHNLPPNLSDAKLKKICSESVDNKKAKITEAKVIRDVKKDQLGKGTGFAFVTFKRHTDALQCLRRLNNNPNIFTVTTRPIVEFSIEKLSAVRKKIANGDLKYQEQDHTDGTDIPDEELPYSGVKSKPFREDEPIAVPKVNRKMYENLKKLKERGKKLIKEKRKEKAARQIKEAKMNRQKRMDYKEEDKRMRNSAKKKHPRREFNPKRRGPN